MPNFAEALPTTVGDWIQVTAYPVVTECPEGVITEMHGAVNALAHVLEVYSDGWVNAFFELTNTVSLIAPDNFKILVSLATGM